MIDLFKEKQDCCGCTACINICPKSAISMTSDEEGFRYPQIDKTQCNECGLCKKVCAFQNGYDTAENFKTPHVYAVKHRDEKVRMNSSSGGAFTAISDYILNLNGVIYGVAFDEKFNVIHQRAETMKETELFRGSKYVQSDLKNIFQRLRADLADGRWVLFTGTPCQAAGLNSFLLNTDKSKLLICDLVCYGTPSPLIWKEHVRFLEKKMKSGVDEYYFRSKVKGWLISTVQVKFKNGKCDYKSALSQAHKTLFFSGNMMRPSCYNCKYTNFNRPSDISIADFWGIEKHMPEFFDNKGVSLVLVNSQKGRNVFETIITSIEYRESNTDTCKHSPLHRQTKLPPRRNAFWKDYKKNGYGFVIKKYGGYGFKNRIKRTAGKFLRKTGLLNLVKNILGRK